MRNTISFAPVKGLTNKYFRTLFLSNFSGIDRVYAPFVSGCGTQIINKSKLDDLLINDKPLLKTIPQIISNDSREIILFGNTLADYGYDEINWNLGCSFPRIANKEKGCGLLPHHDKLKNILDEIFDRNHFPVKLSVKTRLGYQNKDEIFENIKIFNTYPVSEIILHPRTGKQLFKGKIYLDDFKKLISQSVKPVGYNGDIYNKTTWKDLNIRFSEVNHWMIGRGLLINPFLAEQINNSIISDNDKRKRIQQFNYQLCSITNDRFANKAKITGYMKSVWYYLSGSFKNAELVFNKIKCTKTPEELLKVIDEILAWPLSSEEEIKNHFTNGLHQI